MRPLYYAGWESQENTHSYILLMIASFLCALKLGHFLKQKLYNQVITGLLGAPQKLELEFFKAFTLLVYLLACTYGNVCMQLYLYICRYLTGCFSILHKNTATAKRIWSLTSVMLCGSCEAQTWKSSSSTAAGPHADLFFCPCKGSKERWRQLLFLLANQRDCWTIPPYTCWYCFVSCRSESLQEDWGLVESRVALRFTYSHPLILLAQGITES